MSQLPPHHVARTRLTTPLQDASANVVVIEAAAGYGKSVLAAELVRAWGAVPIDVVLEDGPVSARLLAGRLRAAVAKGGYVDAASAMVGAGDDPVGAVDVMLTQLAGESFALVVDDAQHAEREAAALIDRIAEEIDSPGRMIVLARRLPPGAERLRRGQHHQLTAIDLALREDEALSLCRHGFGLDVSTEDVRLLEATTGGWTAATVLAAAQAKRSSRPLRDVVSIASGMSSGIADPIASILDEALVALGDRQQLLRLLTPLPLLDPGIVAVVTGDDDLFDRAMELGLPFTPALGGFWELPGPVRDHLASPHHAPDTEALTRAARYYEDNGQLGMALQVLLAAGANDAVGALLDALDQADVENVDALELLAAYERLPSDVLLRHPRATLLVARSCGGAALLEPWTRLVGHLADSVTHDDASLRRAIDAERANAMPNIGRSLDGEAMGREVLGTIGADEPFTRARALTAIGHGLCAHRTADGSYSEDALAEAATAFDQAATIFRNTGAKSWVSGVAAPRAIWTEQGVGHTDAALAILDTALGDCVGRPGRFGRLLIHRGQIKGELGRFDEAEEDYRSAEEIGHRTGASQLPTFATWGRMLISSYRGDVEGVVHSAHDVEAHAGPWWGAVGAEFLAEAADCLDRVGEVTSAREYFARVHDQPHQVDRYTAMAECALAARHGDPARAEELLGTVHQHGLYPKELWRVTLLRAYAALRGGHGAPATLASRAFEEAARLGHAEAPLVRERELATSLLALAIDTGSASATRLQAISLPVAISVLGRFELSRGGRSIELRSARAAQLVKLVVVSGGRIPVERAIEMLWPGADTAAGRNRLRTVLSRLREDAADVLTRADDVLVLLPDVRDDLAAFEREASQARALARGDVDAAVAVATSAIARYRGDLLPDDLYEEWTQEPREVARQSMLDLLDLSAEAATRRGDVDEARRVVQRTIELAPYDDDRYLRVAAILDDQGRRGAALSVIRRARSTLATLGLELPPQLLERETQLQSGGTSAT